MKKYILLLLLIFSFSSWSQTLNNYKYVIVPAKFEFMNSENEYRLNTITKHNLEKIGFICFYDNQEIPSHISFEECEALKVDVERVGRFIWTKLKIVFKDCNGTIIYSSEIGSSKEKDNKTAYEEALKNAFTSLNNFNYNYSANKKTNSKVTVISDKKATEVVEIQPTEAQAILLSKSDEILFAQPISNGFQLVDSTPKVVFKLSKTDNPSVFLAQKGSLNGVVTLKDGSWFFEYQENDNVVSEKLTIKF
ncbi:hypothetical protein [Flavobacterium orientale]|uniref:Uncharacterized protein n=1 Tax=Flavobacterium orientale TaxID=1756020 RepID=A0A917DF60_9FLAO|nr:hypothetical protein [Flavobacterium orientale]GGD31963.1 hypothetical protein GCM10011343_22600 [Flavobacterium orientale]